MPLSLIAAYLLIGILSFTVSLVFYGSIERYTVGNAEWISTKLDQMFIPLSQKTTFKILMLTPFILGLLFIVLWWPNVFMGLSFALLIIIISFKAPRPFIGILLKKRRMKVNLQLIDGLTLMSSALRSGLSLVQAVQLVVEEMPNPLSQEMNLILSEHRLGVAIEKAFLNFAKRMASEDIEMFVTAVVVLRETGGNLAETFDIIVYTIRERLKLENKISALTMQGVFQGTILIFAPFGLGAFMYLIDPEHMKPLFTTFPGLILILIGLVLLTVGGLMIKKIVTIRI
ncbi:MAG: type II secretion system F family protein [Deltaproteobacteria bacterium]|nr:type II secretion system F family protein [Deltaproteobacteria bacterium]